MIFENGNQDRPIRDEFAQYLQNEYNENKYPVGGGQGSWGYLTIYLPGIQWIAINNTTRDQIKSIIIREIELICRIYKKYYISQK
ncbi:MAG: hypothetical protein KJ607_02215 [Bacteroidetes bacterium]|nr:hypothetical protein [Bacteroidota bacterium]